jgi:hypothetical protein
MAREADTRARFGFVLLAAVFVCAAGPAPAGSAKETKTVDYLHVAANEGGSSGGHVAIRFDDWTYHFQRSDDARLELYRDDSDTFRHRYAVLGNRTIRAHRVGVDAQTWEILRSAFNTAYLGELGRSENLRSLRADERLLKDLAEGGTGAVSVRGAGYFDRTRSAEPALVALRARIEGEYGKQFLERRISSVETALARLKPGPSKPGDAEPGTSPSLPRYGFADRYADLVGARAALEVLRNASAPDVDAFRRPQGAEYLVTEEEAAQLEAAAEDLGEQLTALAQSPRPDWGYAFLVGAARLAAIRMSLESGSFVVPDSYAANAPVVDGRMLARRGSRMHGGLSSELRDSFRRARERLVGTEGPGERVYVRLEESINRLDEFETALRSGGDARVSRSVLVPERGAPGSGSRWLGIDRAELRASYEAARDRRRSYEKRLNDEYGYHLVRRNCASEIFRTIDAAFGAQAEKKSVAGLGGYIDPDSDFTFVPFISADNVFERYNVVETAETPSYRRARLREMYERENDVVVYLREFNTFTSTIYARNLDDSAFFAFTDDVVFARPLLGVANLVTGLGRSLFGIVRLPFDRGAALKDGLLGAMYSVPELAFVNIRKGSQYYVAPERRSVVEEVVVASISPSASTP